jgi:hypothetical protein
MEGWEVEEWGTKNVPPSRQVCKMEKYDDNVKPYIVKSASRSGRSQNYSPER